MQAPAAFYASCVSSGDVARRLLSLPPEAPLQFPGESEARAMLETSLDGPLEDSPCQTLQARLDDKLFTSQANVRDRDQRVAQSSSIGLPGFGYARPRVFDITSTENMARHTDTLGILSFHLHL